MTKRKHRLTKLRLNEISLVDMPADPNATITIFKRGDPTMDPEEIKKQLDAATKSIEDLTKRAEDAEKARDELEGKLEEMTKRAEAAETRVSKAKAGEEDDLEEILKGADPAMRDHMIKLHKANVAAQKRLAEMDEEREIAKAVAAVKSDYQHLPIKPENFGPVLKRMSGTMSEEDFAEVKRVLKAADHAMLTATTMSGPGGYAIAKGTAETRLDSMAKERAEKTGVSFAKAYTEVMRDNPDLYNQYKAETARQ